MHMPFLSKFVHQGNEEGLSKGSKVFRYIADAPTTTTQRLKSMTTGGLPVFFDISNAFSASPVDEDNLVDQFLGAGKRLVFMGDSTWDGLYPTQFNESHAFPCYNIMDLDSVDDGIDELLLPTIKNQEASQWDVLIAHYLGVDHAGHAHGVESDPMKVKLKRIDDSIRRVVETIHTDGLSDVLVLVTGDHGQTLTGDHGGGSPEEVDSVLVAIDVDTIYSTHQKGDLIEKCASNCSCGDGANQCVPDLKQIDLVPTLAGFMNVPIPFVNLGKVSKSLWSLVEENRCKSSFMKIVKANTEQVFKYLDAYTQKPGARFPSNIMDRLRKDFTALKARNNATEEEYIEFLSFMEQSARNVWTQFHEVWMVAGVILFILVVSFQCCLLYFMIQSLPQTSYNQGMLLWILSMIHPIGIFSFFFLLAEGLHLSYLVFAMALALFLLRNIEGADVLSASKAFLLVAFSCIMISKLGLQSHSGFAFWQRLTVHDGNDDLTEQHFGEQVSTLVSEWLKSSMSIHFDPMLVAFGIHYFIPGLFILYIEDSQLRRSLEKNRRYGSWSRLLVYLGFTSMFMYHLVQLGIGWSHTTLNELVGSRSEFMDESLDILLPRICFGTIASLLSLPIIKRMTGGGKYAGSLALFRVTSGLLILTISPIVTPLIMVGLYIEIYGIYSLLGDSDGQRVQWLSLTTCMTVIQSQAFFISGHLCEFSGLLYTAAFVGQRDYDLVQSGVLLGFDTCGCMILVLLISLSMTENMHSNAPGHQKRSRKNTGMFEKPRRIVRDIYCSQPAFGSLIIFGFTRSIVCCSAMISAGIQRRHLYAWSLFAPKFVFEIFFLIITYVVLILVSFLL